MARPKPVLFSPAVGLLESRLKSLNSLSRSSSGMPGPWSRTAMLQVLFDGFELTRARIVEPGGEYLMALLRRLSTTCFIFAGSIVSVTDSGGDWNVTEVCF